MPQGLASWQPKQVATRNLVLLALTECGGTVADPYGHVTAKLRGLCGIPDTANNAKYVTMTLQRLAEEGAIYREMDSARKRTHLIKLLTPLDEVMVADLRASKESNVALFDPKPEGETKGEEVPELDELIRECRLALGSIVRAAESPMQKEGDLVAISVSAALRSVGIYGIAAKRTRYYLREMGYIKSSGRVTGEQFLHWWRVMISPLDCDKLRELASGHRSFERWEAARGGTAAAGPVMIIQGGPSSPHQTSSVLDLVQPELLDSPTPRSQLEAVIERAEELGRDNEALREQLRTQKAGHEQKVAALNSELEELRKKLGIAQQAANLLANLESGTTPAS